jgi:hypothetical protein
VTVVKVAAVAAAIEVSRVTKMVVSAVAIEVTAG